MLLMLILILISLLASPSLCLSFQTPLAVITGATVAVAIRCTSRFLLRMNHFVNLLTVVSLLQIQQLFDTVHFFFLWIKES